MQKGKKEQKTRDRAVTTSSILFSNIPTWEKMVRFQVTAFYSQGSSNMINPRKASAGENGFLRTQVY